MERETHYLCYELPAESVVFEFKFMTKDEDLADEWYESDPNRTTHSHRVNRFAPCGDRCNKDK